MGHLFAIFYLQKEWIMMMIVKIIQEKGNNNISKKKHTLQKNLKLSSTEFYQIHKWHCMEEKN